MDRTTGRPDNIIDYLTKLHKGQWFGFSDDYNQVYANLIIHDGSKSKPTEQECTDGLAQLQTAFDNAENKKDTAKANANQKLKDLGLTDDEIKAIKGIS